MSEPLHPPPPKISTLGEGARKVQEAIDADDERALLKALNDVEGIPDAASSHA